MTRIQANRQHGGGQTPEVSNRADSLSLNSTAYRKGFQKILFPRRLRYYLR